MTRKGNGLIRLENIFMASIAAVAVAVCAAPFVDVTESWAVAPQQFVRATPAQPKATAPVPLTPEDVVPLTARAVTNPEAMLNEVPCTCLSPRQQAMERLRHQHTCRTVATPSCT